MNEISQYASGVREGAFPDDDHSYSVDESEFENFATMVEKGRQM